ncbi:thioredoxin family protein [Mediterraneibacter agrestimuris]|uniref:thioredoxin family protein n=1 Tax=Mediterraneibacter agrestimuris TaxID=2941333 RepID=UPI00203E96E6|nr:thioredoxin domain-containing protein [Mediterraneibacter agrestimuris]
MKIRVTADNYENEVLKCKLPVLVEFYARWCSKCAMMEDILEELAREYDGIFQVCQIEIEESSELAESFEVGIVPTFVVFQEGKPVTAASGLLSRESLARMVFGKK